MTGTQAHIISVGGPVFNRLHDLSENLGTPPLLEACDLRASAKILERKIVGLSIDRHLMSSCPIAGGVMSVGNIESGGQRPIAALVHQEGNVLHMIILIPGNHIKGHAAKLLLERSHRQTQPLDHIESLLV